MSRVRVVSGAVLLVAVVLVAVVLGATSVARASKAKADGPIRALAAPSGHAHPLGPRKYIAADRIPSVKRASSGLARLDSLIGQVNGTAVHPVFGPLPFTDITYGQTGPSGTRGGGVITFDFTAHKLGVLLVTYRYTCLSAIDNVSTHRFIVQTSSNEAIVAAGTTGISSVVDGGDSDVPDTDRVLLSPPPPPPQGPCTVADRGVLDNPATVNLTASSGSWIVRDGLADP
jgi:hypothetical protein